MQSTAPAGAFDLPIYYCRKIIPHLPRWKLAGDCSCSQQVMGSKGERMVWIDLEVRALFYNPECM